MFGRLLISQAFELYRLDYIVMKNQSPKTEENHNVCKKALMAFFGDVYINDITFPMFRDWKINLDKTRSDSTVRNYVIRARVVLDYLRKRGYDVLTPDIIPVPKRAQTLPTYLTKEEVSAMINAARVLRTKIAISLMYGSGIRLSEMMNLDYSLIKDGSFVVLGKGRKQRVCYMDQRTQMLIDQYLPKRTDNNPALLVSQYGTRLTATNVQLMVRLAAKRAGIQQKVTPHTLRHSFATNFIKNNGGLLHLSKMLGHVSTQTTEVYVHLIDNDLKDQFDKFHTV